MMDIDYLIEYESESTVLDFKATQYRKETFYELLKDIIAMANAPIDREKLIITGVKKLPNGEFTIRPIPESEFTDAAIYQKLVIDHIEPDLHIDYVPHLYKGNQLVGIIKIDTAEDRPYMMKKAYGNGKEARRLGESFIRKGTTTAALMRKDIDRIYEKRMKADTFDQPVSFYFSKNNDQQTIELEQLTHLELPSNVEEKKIQLIIDEKEKAEQDRVKAEQDRKERLAQSQLSSNFADLLSLSGNDLFVYNKSLSAIGFDGSSYESRDIETLREDLEHVRETYQEDDNYEFFERQAHQINFTISNKGSKYLEDAVVQIEIPETYGLVIADKLYVEPDDSHYPRIPTLSPNWNVLNYPRYKQNQGVYIFEESLGDLKHLQPKEAFKVPLRITLLPVLTAKEIKVKLTLLGKNLPIPTKATLTIKVINTK